MKLTAIALTFGLATAPVAFAEQKAPESKPAPKAMKMTDAQLDNVTAGQLIEVHIIDVLNNVNVDVDVPVDVRVAAPINAAVAANLLGGGATAQATQFGRIRQP